MRSKELKKAADGSEAVKNGCDRMWHSLRRSLEYFSTNLNLIYESTHLCCIGMSTLESYYYMANSKAKSNPAPRRSGPQRPVPVEDPDPSLTDNEVSDENEDLSSGDALDDDQIAAAVHAFSHGRRFCSQFL